MSFDLDAAGVSRAEIMKKACEHGWTYLAYKAEKKLLYRLPDTFVWGQFKDRATALAAFKAALDEAGDTWPKPKLTKYFITKFDGIPAFWSDKRAKPTKTDGTDIQICLANQLDRVLPY